MPPELMVCVPTIPSAPVTISKAPASMKSVAPDFTTVVVKRSTSPWNKLLPKNDTLLVNVLCPAEVNVPVAPMSITPVPATANVPAAFVKSPSWIAAKLSISASKGTSTLEASSRSPSLGSAISRMRSPTFGSPS